MYKWLPSKELVIVFIVVAIFVGLVAFFTILQPKNSEDTAVAASAEAVSDALLTSASKDTDNDGLADWEEALRGTDPIKADSDGDGTDDGTEVSQGNDPLTPGTGDKSAIEKASTLDITANVEAGGGLSNTDALAINLFKNYLSKKQGGATLTAEDQQAVANAIAASGNVATKPEHFTEANLSIVGNSSSTLVAYKNALEGALAPLLSIKEYELLTLQNAISGTDPNGMQKYDRDLSLYGESIRSLASMNVPRDAVSGHLTVLNAIAAMKTTLTDLKTIPTDPLVAFIAMSTFDAREAAVNQAFRSLGSFLLINNLSIAAL